MPEVAGLSWFIYVGLGLEYLGHLTPSKQFQLFTKVQRLTLFQDTSEVNSVVSVMSVISCYEVSYNVCHVLLVDKVLINTLPDNGQQMFTGGEFLGTFSKGWPGSESSPSKPSNKAYLFPSSLFPALAHGSHPSSLQWFLVCMSF